MLHAAVTFTAVIRLKLKLKDKLKDITDIPIIIMETPEAKFVTMMVDRMQDLEMRCDTICAAVDSLHKMIKTESLQLTAESNFTRFNDDQILYWEIGHTPKLKSGSGDLVELHDKYKTATVFQHDKTILLRMCCNCGSCNITWEMDKFMTVWSMTQQINQVGGLKGGVFGGFQPTWQGPLSNRLQLEVLRCDSDSNSDIDSDLSSTNGQLLL